MREEYIEMRRSGTINIVWFYKFYEQEFEKLSKTFIKVKKDNYGNPYFEPTVGFETFKYTVEEFEREKISLQQFSQAFGISLAMYSSEILEYCDKIMGVQKIEEGIYKNWRQVEETQHKLFYIN